MFILLCGDVAQNLGPNSNELCGFCKTAVIDTDPAVCCDMCDMWVHVSCDLKISLTEYQIFLTDPSDNLWICTLCDTAANQFVTPRASSQSVSVSTRGVFCQNALIYLHSCVQIILMLWLL